MSGRPKLLCCAAASLATVLLTAASMVQAAEVELQIELRGVEATELVSTAIVPSDLLADSAAFDRVTGRWIIAVRPIEQFLTDLTVELTNPGSGAFPNPPLQMALPYDDAVIEIIVPRISQPDPNHVRAVYRGETPAEDTNDHLVDFFQASALIDWMTGGAPAEEVKISEPLARALVVYAEKLDHLLARSTWFGVPNNTSNRAEIIRRILTAAAADEGLQTQLNIGRLQDAFGALKSAEHRLYSRVWRVLGPRANYRCYDDFPVLRSFYAHLSELAEVEPSDYKQLVREQGFTRTQVLLKATECFRQLIVIEDGRRFVYPDVVTEPFKGKRLTEVSNALQRDLEHELRAIRFAEPQRPGGARCEGVTLHAREEQQVCRALAYLEELRPLITEDIGNVTQ